MRWRHCVNLSASLATATIDLSTIPAGGTIWAGAIFDYKTGTSHGIGFSGGTVSGLGFSISATGDVFVTASNGGATVGNDTGIDTTAGTCFFLLRRRR